MARPRKASKTTLDARFRFGNDSFPSGTGTWNSQLLFASGIEDGEPYLLRLFKKTGTPLDDDLRRLVTRGLRRVRRVLSSRRARDILVEVLGVEEDDNEIAIVMLDPGSPVLGTSHRVRARQPRFMTAQGRRTFWRNIMRVAEGLALCHDAGIVHGAVSEHAIFSRSDDHEDYRLGGYEACVHIADGDLASLGHLLRASGAVSFRQDWSDLGQTAARILDIQDGGGPPLLPIESRMLERLANPPQYQLFDGGVVLGGLSEVVDELERAGSSAEGELVLYLSRQVMQSDVPALTSGTIQADDTEALLNFIEEDMQSPTVRVGTVSQTFVRIVTDLAVYGVRVVDERVGSVVEANKRRPDDRVYDAVDLEHRLNLLRSRKDCEERVLKLGLGAKRWGDLKKSEPSAQEQHNVSTWYALILLEAFTLLREQFRFYPVEVLSSAGRDEADTTWVISRADPERDKRRIAVGLRPAAEALRRELLHDDDRTDWTLSSFDTLAGGRERLSELTFDGTGQIDGKLAYAFTASERVLAANDLFFRPRRDGGFERAIRRRLQNIVAARTNVELLRALDDPAQVALDDVLRDMAPPSDAPAGMDPSKKTAWDAIVAGRSINVVVGPPGVGKTYLIAQLVKSVLSQAPDARILVSAQNHETLVHMEDELRKELSSGTRILVRVERSSQSAEISSLRNSSVTLLQSVSSTDADNAALMVNQLYQIKQALRPVADSERAVGDRVFRDTDNLLLRSSDVTLATTSSQLIEEMIADGEQFDWVIVEEAARANGAELIGALLLGNRRIMIGDHRQLSPFDAAERQKFYDEGRAAELLRDARKQLATISDLPAEVDAALETIMSDPILLKDVLATAARLEEPFRSIAEREEGRERSSGRASLIANTLLEQSRMHPAIGELVSNTFYRGTLVSSDRVKRRGLTVATSKQFPKSPIVILNLPSLSTIKKRAFEQKVARSFRNEAEATSLLAALTHLNPVMSPTSRRPTLVVLSPYLVQVNHLERLLKPKIDAKNGTFRGFASPRDDGKFVYTSDSFQGGEADVVVASLVRNNVLVGSRSLGFLKSAQRMNVLLSRAKQKLVLATSLQFIREAVDGTDPDQRGGELAFLRKMLSELTRLSEAKFADVGVGATILTVDEQGRLPA